MSVQTTIDINKSICEATDIIVKRAIEKAKFDRTLKASIVSLKDENKNLYVCKYQDITFEAYATGGSAFSKDENVYVLVPDADMSNDKVILGAYNITGNATVTNKLYWRTSI